MAPGAEADALYLERILETIGLVQGSLEGMAESDFLTNRDKVDLTAFRLFQIGELTNKLSQDLKQRHPEIAWPSIYGLRNLIAHHYEKTKPDALWTIARNSLDALCAVCRQEAARLEP